MGCVSVRFDFARGETERLHVSSELDVFSVVRLQFDQGDVVSKWFFCWKATITLATQKNVDALQSRIPDNKRGRDKNRQIKLTLPRHSLLEKY